VLLAVAMVLASAAAFFMPNLYDQPSHDGPENADNAGLALLPASCCRGSGGPKRQ
jgi:hypothetical protein